LTPKGEVVSSLTVWMSARTESTARGGLNDRDGEAVENRWHTQT
jgi:hypothetical protein